MRARSPVDHRGLGRSDKPHDPQGYAMPLRVADAVAVLDELGIQRAHFIGLPIALTRPGRVSRVRDNADVSRPVRSSRRGLGALLMLALALVVATTVAVLAAGSDTNPDRDAAKPTGSSGIKPSKGTCPRSPQALPPDAIAGATRAALREAPSLYADFKNLEGMRALAAAVGSAHQRGGQVRGQFGCSGEVQRRTVVVDLLFPAEPGASLSQGVVFVALIDGGYRVWALVR